MKVDYRIHLGKSYVLTVHSRINHNHFWQNNILNRMSTLETQVYLD